MEHSYTGSFTKITAIGDELPDHVGTPGTIALNRSGSKIDSISFGYLSSPEQTLGDGEITSSFFLPYGTSIEAPIFRVFATGTGSLLIQTGKTPSTGTGL